MDILKVFTFIFFLTLFGILRVPVAVYADYCPDGEDWMKNLDDDLLITQITIPGTHDSAADHDHCAENPACHAVIEYASTQTYNIQSQMRMGIRFFDVRLAYSPDNIAYQFHHGPYDLRQNVYDVLCSAKDFLHDHPSEFLIWLIKQEHTDEDADDFWAGLSNVFSDKKFADFVYLKKKILTVGEARGKLIVMARNYSSEYDQGYHVEWDDNTAYDIGSDSGLTYIAEDHYNFNPSNTLAKFIDIRRNLFLATHSVHCGSQDTLFFTFLSAESDSWGYGPAHYADYENPHTVDFLGDTGLGPRAGIVAMDFAGDSAHHGDALLDTLIGQNFPHRVPRPFLTNNDGGGITVTDIDSNGKPDLVVMNIFAPSGENRAFYTIGWNLNAYGYTEDWTDHDGIPWSGWSQQGGGITATDMNDDGIPDLIVFKIDNPDGENQGYYRIGYMNESGGVSTWTDFIRVPGWFGDSNDGGGITVTDINQNGKPDLVVMSIDNPSGVNKGYYRIGWDLSDGRTDHWTGPYEIPWLDYSTTQAGGGITAADANGDGTPDLMVYMVDNPDGPNHGYYTIGLLDSNGTVTKWTGFDQDAEWIGGGHNGGGITVYDIDNNGKLDLIPFVIYALEVDDEGNRGYYRILWDQGTQTGSD